MPPAHTLACEPESRAHVYASAVASAKAGRPAGERQHGKCHHMQSWKSHQILMFAAGIQSKAQHCHIPVISSHASAMHDTAIITWYLCTRFHVPLAPLCEHAYCVERSLKY